MSIKVVCDACGTVRRVNDRMAGRTLRCPSCEAPVQVAVAAADGDADVPSEGYDDGTIDLSTLQSGGGRPLAREEDEVIGTTANRDADLGEDWTTAASPLADSDSLLVDADDSAETVGGRRSAWVEDDGDAVGRGETQATPVATVAAPAMAAPAMGTPGVAEVDDPIATAVTAASIDDDDDDEEVMVRAKKPEEEMDMTPMVDVTFLLLIFFMVTAAFSLQKSIQMPRQQTEAPSTTVQEDTEDELETVDLEVDEFGSFLVLAPEWERETPGKQNLITALREAAAGRDDAMKLNVKVHESAKMKFLVDAMDAGTIAQYSPIEVTQVEEFE